jgi:hypothetical protein
MDKYITAGDIILDEMDIKDIDRAGAEVAYKKEWERRYRGWMSNIKHIGVLVLLCVAVWMLLGRYMSSV